MQLIRDKMFAALLTGFTLGIAPGSFVDFGWPLPVFFAGLAIVLLFSARSGEARAFFTVSLFFLAFSLGLSREEMESYRYQNSLAGLAGEKSAFLGTVAEFPDVREGSSRFIFQEKKTGENILVIADLYPAVRYGDELELSGSIRPVKNFSADGVNFNYKKYLEKDGVFNEMLYPKISIISSGNGNPVLSALFSAREKFSDQLRQNIGEPESSLALGMLIGEKHAIPESVLNDFKRAGVIHLVVLSGYNIALVSQFFMKMFSFLPIVFRAASGGAAIVLFVLMTGGGASAIRAAVMALIALLGVASGRPYDAGRALFIAGFLMLLQNPNVLMFDPSFQLSFLATLGLIYLTPIIFSRLGNWRPASVKELLAQTIATQVAVLPLLIYLSGSVSLMALPANLLILPSVPFAMMGAFATGLIGFIGHAVALPFALATSVFLSHAISTAKFFAALPFASVSAGKTTLALVLLIYVIFFFFYFLWQKNKAPPKQRMEESRNKTAG